MNTQRQLSTEAALLIVYGDVNIPLSEICERYFGLNETQAKRQALAKQQGKPSKLPITAFRLGDNQKAPWLVRAADLAKFTDEAHAEAKSIEA